MGKNYALSVRFFGLVRPVRLGRTTNGLVRSESEVRGKSAFKVRTKSGPGRTAKWPVLLIPNHLKKGVILIRLKMYIFSRDEKDRPFCGPARTGFGADFEC